MSGLVKNEGFRVLEDAIYVVGPRPDGANSRTAGGVQSTGLGFLGESVTVIERALNGASDIDLQHCQTEALIAVVEMDGRTLSPEKLRSIHEIALTRFASSADKSAQRLMRLVMQVTAGRVPT